jgi:hypothetical protein
LKSLTFSFLPFRADTKHESVEISMSQVNDGYEFKCEEASRECVHPLPSNQVPTFLLAIGADHSANPFEAVQHLVEEGKVRDVHAAIHATLKPSFVWTSTDWS